METTTMNVSEPCMKKTHEYCVYAWCTCDCHREEKHSNRFEVALIFKFLSW